MEQIMGDMDIAFPNLGIYLRNVPKTIMVGSFGIALYGIMIAAAMLVLIGEDARLFNNLFLLLAVNVVTCYH